MLLSHIQSFSFVAAARANPTVLGPLDGANWWIWLATYVLADGKFVTIFSLLFGATIVLLAEGAERAGRSPARLHYRRTVVLLVLGLLHGHLLWYGDMLAPMAICGALAFLYAHLPPARLLGIGLAVFAVTPLLALGQAWLAPMPPDVLTRAVEAWAPSGEAVAREIGIYRSGWLTQMEHRVPTAFATATSALATRGLWQLTGLMLAGIALYRLGVLSGARYARFYATMAVVGFGAGIPLIAWGLSHSVATDWDLRAYRVAGDQLNYVGDALVAFGWMGIVMLVCRRGWAPGPLAAVGRMALTNYVLQTVICTTLFYGHGLGLFGRVDQLGQLAIVVGTWGVQLGLSVWWLRQFGLGPLEWISRSLIQDRRVPLRRPRTA
jgi:uncharacterized protein